MAVSLNMNIAYAMTIVAVSLNMNIAYTMTQQLHFTIVYAYDYHEAIFYPLTVLFFFEED